MLGEKTKKLLGEPTESGREDLNLRPPAPHADALPGCATSRQNLESPQSGREDLNLRPPAPETGALTRLRHSPPRAILGREERIRTSDLLHPKQARYQATLLPVRDILAQPPKKENGVAGMPGCRSVRFSAGGEGVWKGACLGPQKLPKCRR